MNESSFYEEHTHVFTHSLWATLIFSHSSVSLLILPASATAEMVTKATRKTFNILTTFDQDLWGKTNSRQLPSSCWPEAGGAVQQECKTDPSQALSNDILVDVTSRGKWRGEPDWTDPHCCSSVVQKDKYLPVSDAPELLLTWKHEDYHIRKRNKQILGYPIPPLKNTLKKSSTKMSVIASWWLGAHSNNDGYPKTSQKDNLTWVVARDTWCQEKRAR